MEDSSSPAVPRPRRPRKSTKPAAAPTPESSVPATASEPAPVATGTAATVGAKKARKPIPPPAPTSAPAAALAPAHIATPESVETDLRPRPRPRPRPRKRPKSAVQPETDPIAIDPVQPALDLGDHLPQEPDGPAALDKSSAAETTTAETTTAETTTAIGQRELDQREPARTSKPIRTIDDAVERIHRLAERAVRDLGLEAARAVDGWRRRYPAAGADGLARLAVAEFSRTPGLESLLSVAAGPVGAALGFRAALRTHASLVLRIAAAYGLDPADPQRAVEILELLRLPREGTAFGPALAKSRRLLGEYALRRAARLVLPFGVIAGLVVAVARDRRDTADLGARAIQYYRRTATASFPG